MRFFASFDELYATLPLNKCGYTEEEAKTASPRDMDAYYSPQEQAKWGVVGIEVSLL
jgi:ASC-1-like (ASCH) protein